MGMKLVELLSWVAVELDNPKPDLDSVRKAVQEALQRAARLDLEHEVRKEAIVRLARAVDAPKD